MCEDNFKKQGVFLKNPMQYNDFLKSPSMESVRQAVSSRIGLRKSLDAKTFKVLFRGCAFGHAIFNSDAWCAVFSNQELRLIEMLEDLDDYFGDAYGRNFNSKVPCSLGLDVSEKFIEQMKETGEKKSFLRFSHAGAIKPFASFLGLYDLLNSNLGENHAKCRVSVDLESREWKSSLISPFSANFAFVLYKCDDQFKVLTRLQETPIKLPRCPSDSYLCPLEQFTSIMERIPRSECKHDNLCRI